MWESRVLRRAFERLELHEGKLSRAVLRGGGGGDVTSLPDPQGAIPGATRPNVPAVTPPLRLFSPTSTHSKMLCLRIASCSGPSLSPTPGWTGASSCGPVAITRVAGSHPGKNEDERRIPCQGQKGKTSINPDSPNFRYSGYIEHPVGDARWSERDAMTEARADVSTSLTGTGYC